MNEQTTTAWQQYEAGKEYKRRIGFYEKARTNERFYKGDQWYESNSDLPRPVFNLVRRIADFLVGSILPGDISIRYTDEKLPFLESSALRKAVQNGLSLLEENASYRWKKDHMNAVAHDALLDAVLSGDGVFYCWWDDRKQDGQPFCGDIRTDCVDSASLFVADVNNSDLQTQDYVILSGRASVDALRREAMKEGLSAEQASRIVADGFSAETILEDTSLCDLSGSEKATYLLRFFRENGEVICEKSTQNCVIRRFPTGLRFYPVAHFHWLNGKNCYLGASPICEIIANQKYINTAYAMVMKHMRDTAFSKVVYDKSRIPEWSNEVGEAIAAMGGGNVADAISVVGVGKMQDGYLSLLDNVIENTKSMMGATESALGDEKATNTSAILALQEASRIALTHTSANFRRCIGELATIWADMICTYYPNERFLAISTEDGVKIDRANYRLLKDELLCATVQTAHTSHYTPSTTVLLLDKLLGNGHISVTQYLKLLPVSAVPEREKILKTIQSEGALTHE